MFCESVVRDTIHYYNTQLFMIRSWLEIIISYITFMLMPLILHSPLTTKNTQTAIVFGLFTFISMQL